MERVIGFDMGYGFIKVTDGQRCLRFPSVIGEALGRQRGAFGLHKQAVNNEDDISVTIGDQTYFVGDLAIRQSRVAHRGLSPHRTEGDDLKVLLLSALSTVCREPVNEFYVVTGLPPGRMHYADQLAEQLRGRFAVTRHQGRRDVEYVINLNTVEVVPQPLGTYWSQVLDERGGLREHSSLLSGRVGVVDIGFRTSDFATVIDGEYAPAFSRTVPVGMVSSYESLAQILAERYGLERETYALDSTMIEGSINVNGHTENIEDIRDEALAQLALKLMVEVRSTWQLAEYDAVLISGGGAHMLGDIMAASVKQCVRIDNPSTANARGYHAWGMYRSFSTSGA
jgi:plasmid segregation protein ParM